MKADGADKLDLTLMTAEESTSEKTAPAPLSLVQSFVNSVHIHSGREPEEELETPEALRDWLARQGLMEASEPVGADDLTRALDVREGLRALLLAHNGDALDGERVAALDRAARRAGVRVAFGPEGRPDLAPDVDGVDGALARLLSIVAAAEEQGIWRRLKACPRDCCLWAFYDHSKNRSGRWCSMDSCGNVEKARAFRERRRETS